MENNGTLIAGVATGILFAWWAIERAHARGCRALTSTDCDRGSVRLWDVAHAIQLAGMAVGFIGVGRIRGGGKIPIQLCGLALLVSGIVIRSIAIYTLGRFFTGRVQIQTGHHLVQDGLYSRLRHPAYTGSLLAHLGIGLAFWNWWTLVAGVLPYVVAVSYRIRVEENALNSAFGAEYAEYQRTSNRIIPWLY